MNLSKRKLGIGGSDVASILGIKAFKTAVEIWEDKINPEVEELILRPDDSTSNLYWGKALEDKIIEAYKLTENNDVTYGNNLEQFHHPEYPWLIANIDGIAHTKEHGDIILEVKHWSFDPNEEWGESGTDNIPMQYMCQVQHYMNVLNMSMAHVALKVGCDFRVFKIPRSEKIINRTHSKLEHFWFENVKKKIAPEPSNLKDVRIIYKDSETKDKEATDEQIKAIRKIRRSRDRISRLEDVLNKRKVRVGKYMGECGRLVSSVGASSEIIATFNSNKNGTRVFRVTN